MRFNAGHAEVQAEGFAEQRGFSIAASGKAFKGLIDGLYSRKIEAITRELSTNAFDAHKAAGTLVPFELHLPSKYDAVWFVRDFGTGMSHSLVMNRYTTLFDSTKDGLVSTDYQTDNITEEANKQVGQLGLGSKSFFAYTDACTITSWQDGVMRVYSVFMGADGVPQIAYAGEMASDEPTGVKIEFPVNVKDVEEFKQAAIRVFKGFPILPKGLPSDVVEAIQEKPYQVGEFWKAFSKVYLPGGGYYARQGCVLYPIDLTQIDNKATLDEKGNAKLSSNYARFQNANSTIVIDFPIGSVDFDLSRERLAYNEATITNIRSRWDQFAADLDSHFTQRFAECTTPWQIMRHTDSPLLSGFGPLFTASRYSRDAEKLRNTLHDKGLPRNKRYRGSEGTFHSATRPSSSDPRGYKTVYTREDYAAPGASSFSNAVLIYRDEKKRAGINQRISAYLKEQGVQWGYLIDEGCLTLKNYRLWGKPDIVRLSDIPALPKAPRDTSYTPPPFARIKVFNKNFSLVAATGDEDFSTGYLFAFINKGRIANPDPERYKNYSISDMQSVSLLLEATTGKKLAFINIRAREKFEKFPDYPLFYDQADNWIDHIDDQSVRWAVDILNSDRFDDSRYTDALKKWTKLASRRDRRRGDPLLNLNRFTRRDRLVPKDKRPTLGLFLHSGEDLRNQIIERARAAGLEVLPPMAWRTWYGDDNIPGHRLLPKRWERLVTALGHSTGHEAVTDIYHRHLKEQYSC